VEKKQLNPKYENPSLIYDEANWPQAQPEIKLN
jgi:hypothetical protein